MPRIKPLPPSRLHSTYDPARIPWQDSSAIPLPKGGKNGRSPFQPRAMQALDLATGIKLPGYHVYLSGDADLGRSYMLRSYLEPLAAASDTPADLVYVQNFADADKPVLLRLGPGQGRKLKEILEEFVQDIGINLEKRLDSPNFARERATIFSSCQSRRGEIVASMLAEAQSQGFNLEMDESSGFALSLPQDEASAAPDPAFRQAMRQKGERLTKKLTPRLRELAKIEDTLREMEQSLEQKAMRQTLDALFAPFEHKALKFAHDDGFTAFLAALKADILKNTAAFLPAHPLLHKENDARPQDMPDDGLRRYEVNLFVDNGALHGAPIVMEDNPTAANLLGCMERESEMGALVTDYTLIRAGSLHRANGGFLVVHAEDILRHPPAWEGLLRALRSNQALMDDGSDFPDAPIRTKALRPEPVPLDVKVILIGDENLYETLLYNEDRFGRIFRIKAHMSSEVEKNPANIRHYLIQLARIIHEAHLLPFDSGALAWLIDLGSHLCEDQRRLSLRFPVLRDYMVGADALARAGGREAVSAGVLEEAYANQAYRSNLVESQYLEEYARDLIKVRTSGAEIGQVNGLAVTLHGDYEFGLPHRISCAVGVGHDGIIDLEREAELGGPIHTKAMMILKSYLTRIFARKKPLVLSASLYFEQNYAEIEGDSASGAELAALITALADVPARLDLAFTGAVSHTGEIMPVGAVTRKIEGFYKICRQRGLTGTQGVLIPADNADHLMLDPEILASVERGQFAIYPVKNMEEALALLTGLPVGRRLKNGGFSKDSLFDLADKRLDLLGAYAQNAFRTSRKARPA